MESHERLIAKLDRLGAEAGIKEMTPEIYRFAQLLNDEKMKQWDEWRAKREWVGLTIEEIASCCRESTTTQLSFAQELEAKLKEKNT
jgi:hypothetical protein